MNANRKVAIVAGALLIIATVADLISRLVLLQPILGSPDYLTKIAANEGQVLLGALFLFIGAVSAPAIALALYPVVRKHNEGLAIGSVGFRLIEGALYAGIVVCLLVLVTVSQSAASSAQETPGLLMAARDSLGEVAVMTFGLGAFMYYGAFYQSRLVPRWLSAWGLLAVASLTVSAVLVIFQVVEPLSTPQVVLALPIAVQEMVLALWLIIKGFNPSAVEAAPASDPSRWRAAASREPAA